MKHPSSLFPFPLQQITFSLLFLSPVIYFVNIKEVQLNLINICFPEYAHISSSNAHISSSYALIFKLHRLILQQSEKTRKQMLQKTKKLNVTSHKQINQFKVALVGDQQAGKSCFMSQYLEQTYPSYYEATLGVQAGDKYVPTKNGISHLTLWDFSGKIDFAQLRNQFYRECQKILLFVDLTSKASVDGVDYWFKEIKQGGGSCSITVVGSKADNKKVNSDVSGIAKSNGCNYVQISSKNKSGIQQLMQKVMSEFK